MHQNRIFHVLRNILIQLKDGSNSIMLAASPPLAAGLHDLQSLHDAIARDVGMAQGLATPEQSAAFAAVDRAAQAHFANMGQHFPHYFKDVRDLDKIDIYRVAELWEVTNHCLFHALKKTLVAGKRGAKDAEQDVAEAIASLQRWQEMRKEERG
jgi:hypothetical protein